VTSPRRSLPITAIERLGPCCPAKIREGVAVVLGDVVQGGLVALDLVPGDGADPFHPILGGRAGGLPGGLRLGLRLGGGALRLDVARCSRGRRRSSSTTPSR